ncbi:8911_t:CDS:2 [Funneliformis geosporum]|uniref:12054_t:CDS:1 n=1 Tax=Funneliformis geosporum TaxID=1117311 RepID=A0A9W4SQG9_9GLOM|nr:12054_t:CDS:2 [Funneliformis geosporum]CAI2186263.1 8911_t:CDS:2 [Funneliformis geosporum]
MHFNDTPLKYKPKKNTCVICGICEICEFNAVERNSFAKFVELNAFWNVEADFDEDFYYCLYDRYYQNAIDYDKKAIKETLIEEISSDELEKLDSSLLI